MNVEDICIIKRDGKRENFSAHKISNAIGKAFTATGLNDQEALIDEINKNYASELSVEQMARNNGMSTAWLNQRFKQYTGLSPQQYITKTRLSHARQMLSEPAYNIGEIAQMCGYSDPLYFSRLFHARFGCSPKEFRLRIQTQHP